MYSSRFHKGIVLQQTLPTSTNAAHIFPCSALMAATLGNDLGTPASLSAPSLCVVARSSSLIAEGLYDVYNRRETAFVHHPGDVRGYLEYQVARWGAAVD